MHKKSFIIFIFLFSIILAAFILKKICTPSIDISKVPFGSIFTPHMFIMEWDQEHGWHNQRIEKYHDFSLNPACMALHYGQEIFEGMKAFAQKDGNIGLFRPEDHFNRMNISAARMCMPEINVQQTIEWLKKLILKDKQSLPTQAGTALYIRPTMIANESTLYLKPSGKYIFFIVLSPVGSLHANGFNPIAIWVSDSFTRSSVGGVGAVKTGGNYAASMLAQKHAKEEGCAQVLWLDPIKRTYIEEVGSMNIFFVINETLVTPELTGTILPGITRKSIIELAKVSGMTVIERRISIDEVIQGIKEGSVSEIFGTGTAASITPVGQIKFKNEWHTINDNKTGPITQQLFTLLQEIQYGMKSTNWIERI